MTFHFEPDSERELRPCSIRHASIENKDLYVIDNYFDKEACAETRRYFEKASYSRLSYSTSDSEMEEEHPGYSMNTKERWSLFYQPPASIRELHELLGELSVRLNAEISTAPWELSHQAEAVTPSVIVNYHTQVSPKSMLAGRHRDCDPAKGLFYGIPILYKEKGAVHENSFENGATGKPWLVSALLYAASECFLPEYRMGTVYYKTDGEAEMKTDCLDGRLVLFEGDLFHSVEDSHIPPEAKPWRTSYVLKLVINPREETQNVKQAFSEFSQKWSSEVSELCTGALMRI